MTPTIRATLTISLVSCATPPAMQTASSTTEAEDHDRDFSEDENTPNESEPPQDDDEGTEDNSLSPDDALVVGTDLPMSLTCGESAEGRVVMRNTGFVTWSMDDGYKLGAVDDSDPFLSEGTRILLTEHVTIPSGDVWSFEFELTAPDVPGLYVTDWRMVHEGIHWFGETHTQEIEVTCSDLDEPPPPPDLDDAVWLHSDVSTWAETSVLSSVYATDSEICLEYDMADVWPIYDLGGTDVVGNPWIFIWEDDVWYAGTWEWLRPGQTCKNINSVAGSHIKVSPFGEDSGWVPTSGQTYYFMVSGLGRWSERTVEERTNLVPFVWP